MAVKSGWFGKLYWIHEMFFGTPQELGTYRLWETDEADSLTLGEVPANRVPIYGMRFAHASSYNRAGRLPGGSPGSIPWYFETDGLHEDMLRIMRAHFQQYSSAVDLVKPAWLYTFTPVTTSEPTAWKGLAFARDWGIASQDYNWQGGAIDTLVFSWTAAGELKLKPTLKFLSASETTISPTTLATPMTTARHIARPYMSVTWNGTAIHPEAIEITSSMGLVDRTSPSVVGRTGLAMGQYTATLKLSTWIDDDFWTHFVTPYTNATVGTFILTMSPPETAGTYAGGAAFYASITAYARINPLPPMPLKKGAGIEQVVMSLVTPNGFTSPLKVEISSDYDGIL